MLSLIRKSILFCNTIKKSNGIENIIKIKNQSQFNIYLKNSAGRYFSITSDNLSSIDKKKGQFVETKENEGKKVKLYPGFQKSLEDITEESLNDQELYAKQVIEDFYGLNEIEIDEEKDFEKEMQEEIEEENATFDLDYVTKLLRKENVQEICCIQIPQEVNYADFMVIGTCLSEKHLNSTFININKKYKKFKQEDDLNLQRKSGKETKWCAIDTGRIVIHLFSEGFREFYDLESLWTCGPEFDDKYNDFLEEQREIEKKLIVVDDDSYNK